MKNIKWILIFLMISTLSLCAQQQPDQKSAQGNNRQEDGITNPTSNGAQQDADRQDTQGDAAGAADTPGAAEAAADANTGRESGEGTEAAVNAPAIAQSTASDAGSPAVPSDNNGKQRDGTNTVQRASMNMAGSPANNIRLPQGTGSNADSAMADRQVYEQEKKASARNEETRSGTTSSGGDADNINNNTRRENNEASDQNLSAKEKSNEKSNN